MRVIFNQTGQTGTIPDDKFDPSLFSRIDSTQSQPSPQMPQTPSDTIQPSSSPSVGGFIGNVGKGVVGAATGLLNLPGAVAKLTPIQGLIDMAQGKTPDIMQPAKTAIEMLKNYASSLNQDIGKPLEGGNVIGRIGQNLYNRPVETALDVLPLISAGKAALAGRAGATGAEVAAEGGKIARAGEVASKTPSISEVGAQMPSAGGLKAGAARSVIRPELGRSTIGTLSTEEGIAKDVMDITKGGTPYGIAKSVEGIYDKVNATLDQVVDNVSKDPLTGKPKFISLGSTQEASGLLSRQPGGVMDKIMSGVEQLTTDNSIISKAQKYISDKLEASGMSGQTTIGDINVTRTDINAQLKKWYKSGSPTVTATDQYNMVLENASENIGKYLAEQSPQIKELVNLQARLIPSYKGLYKQVSGGGEVMAGSKFRIEANLIRPAIQTVQSLFSRNSNSPFAQRVSELIGTQGGQMLPLIPTAAEVGRVSKSMPNVDPVLQGKPVVNTSTTRTPDPSTNQTPKQLTYTLPNLIKDVHRDPKNKAYYEWLYNSIQKTGGVSATQQTANREKGLLSQVNTLSGYLDKVPETGPGVAAQLKIDEYTGTPDPNLESFAQNIAYVKESIAAEVHRRAPTNQEFTRLLFPSVAVSKATNQQRIKNLKNFMQDIFQTYPDPGGAVIPDETTMPNINTGTATGQ